MQDVYGIAAFRSRQQVLRFEDVLHREGIPCGVVTTPRAVALGCGLSVRFDIENAQRVKALLRRAEQLCPDATYTLELTEDKPSAIWLKENELL